MACVFVVRALFPQLWCVCDHDVTAEWGFASGASWGRLGSRVAATVRLWARDRSSDAEIEDKGWQMTKVRGFSVAKGASLFALLIAAGGPACSCEDPGSPLAQLSPKIRVYAAEAPETLSETLTIDFGEVPSGAVLSRVVGVRNVGNAVLYVCPGGELPAGSGDATAGGGSSGSSSKEHCTEASRVQPEDAPFSFQLENLDDKGLWALTPEQSREFVVRFRPEGEGERTATLLLVSNASNRATTLIQLHGVGVVPRLELNHEQLDFGDVTVGRRVELGLAVTNTTQFPLSMHFDPIEQDSVVFGLVSPDGTTVPYDEGLDVQVAGNASRMVEVFFVPLTEGSHENLLRARFCEAAACARTVGLKGRGVKPVFVLEPDALDFGAVVQTRTASKAFSIRNVGNVALTVRSTSLESGSSRAFSVKSERDLPAMIDVGEALSVTVRYDAATPGLAAGRVVVATDAWDDPSDPINNAIGFVRLSAETSGPDIVALPSSVNFGTVPAGSSGSSAAIRKLIVSNVGTTVLTISSYALASPPSQPSTTEFTVKSMSHLGNPASFPLALDPGASLDVELAYVPVDHGPDATELSFDSDDPDEPTLVVPVRGIGGIASECSITVSPSDLTFGLVERGRTATLPVALRNNGSALCHVSNVKLDGGSSEFSLDASAVSALPPIAPGAWARIDITYAPIDYSEDTTTFVFDVDDPVQPRVEVPVFGMSAESDVLVIPNALEFGVVPVRCASPEQVVTVYNAGASPVVVNQVYLDPSTSPEFELAPYAPNQTIVAGGQSEIRVRYHPTDIGPDTGLMFVAHSAATVPVAVPLTGDGRVTPTVSDDFEQLPAPQADVLFVVDNSLSMEEEQSLLGANLGSFLTYARNENIDYHIAVTTTDVDPDGEAGRFVGAQTTIITPSTPDPEGVFAANANVGIAGSPSEQGLQAAYLALSDPLINTVNAGFLRPDAALAIVFVSDEEDSSPQTDAFYESFFRNIKGFQNRRLFSASAIVGRNPPPFPCNGPGGEAFYGGRYIQLATATNGVVESICLANWGQTLANIGATTFGLRRQFTLSSNPAPSTIQVQVNGTVIPATGAAGAVHWTYDETDNVITFEPDSTPAAGAAVKVTYAVGC